MADPLLELLLDESKVNGSNNSLPQTSAAASTLGRYLSRLLSLRPSDLTTTEPQSLAQSSQSNILAVQALSSRSHRSTTTSSDQLASLGELLPQLSRTINEVKNNVPSLDESAINFADIYSKSRATNDSSDNVLAARKESMLFSRQASKMQDMVELPALLSTAIASAASSPAGSANYSQALDLYAHIKRLSILYPDSALVVHIQAKAEEALKDMTTNLLAGLRVPNIRLAAAIRTIGWLRRIVPELGLNSIAGTGKSKANTTNNTMSYSTTHEEQSEGSFGALFLVCRLSTFLSLTEDALAPLRDLADQETEKRLQSNSGPATNGPAQPVRRASAHGASMQGQQTERYLKRYIEIFREQSFSTIQMYRNIFPSSTTKDDDKDDILKLPSALASFPMHLVNLLMETLQKYIPNITDSTARESLLIQVIYAANSLGRLGCDFSMMISMLDLPETEAEEGKETEPEWYRVIKKHKIQAARLDALSSGQERRVSQDAAVK